MSLTLKPAALGQDCLPPGVLILCWVYPTTSVSRDRAPPPRWAQVCGRMAWGEQSEEESGDPGSWGAGQGNPEGLGVCFKGRGLSPLSSRIWAFRPGLRCRGQSLLDFLGCQRAPKCGYDSGGPSGNLSWL